MTVVTLNRRELEKKIGKITEKTEEKISMFGTTVESINDNEISLEIYPNRPDLLSLQGVSRALNSYLNKPVMPQFKVNKPEKNYKVIIEKSVKSVRPFTACAVVKNLKLNDEKIKEIIDIQEKLHLTLGRKRKKLAIGIYPMEKIKFPIKFTAKTPEEIKFIPLESDIEMTGRQILSKHPAGREYAHLLTSELFPIFIDANNKILSMPPIINSNETGKITQETKEVFIECSGFNLPYLKKVINILAAAFADMQSEIYAIEIEDKESFISPDLEPEKLEFKIEDINKTLGLNLEEKQIKEYLSKMNIGFEQKAKQNFAIIPAYRADILHWIDLAEEIAIAYGYDNFEPEIPKISSIAEENKKEIVKKIISNILSGLGLLETSSFHLTKKEDIKKMYFDFKYFIELENSKTEYNVLRIDILNNLMKILSENSDSTYPQKIFELGTVFSLNKAQETGIQEKERLAIVLVDENTNFTEIKQILDYLFKMLDKEYKILPIEDSNYIHGRAGKIIVNEKEIGILGEISPRVIRNFKLKMPVAALELNLEFLH